MSIEENEPQSAGQQTEQPYIGDTMRNLEERFSPRIEEAKEQLNVLNLRLKGFIRENPGTSLACAVGIGYLVGKLASRR